MARNERQGAKDEAELRKQAKERARNEAANDVMPNGQALSQFDVRYNVRKMLERMFTWVVKKCLEEEGSFPATAAAQIAWRIGEKGAGWVTDEVEELVIAKQFHKD